MALDPLCSSATVYWWFLVHHGYEASLCLEMFRQRSTFWFRSEHLWETRESSTAKNDCIGELPSRFLLDGLADWALFIGENVYTIVLIFSCSASKCYYWLFLFILVFSSFSKWHLLSFAWQRTVLTHTSFNCAFLLLLSSTSNILSYLIFRAMVPGWFRDSCFVRRTSSHWI